MKRIALLVILTLIAAPLSAHRLSSPNSRLSIEVKVQSKRPVYSITYAGKTVVAASAVGFDFAEGYFGEGVSLGKAVRRTVTDDYDLPVAKTYAGETYNLREFYYQRLHWMDAQISSW